MLPDDVAVIWICLSWGDELHIRVFKNIPTVLVHRAGKQGSGLKTWRFIWTSAECLLWSGIASAPGRSLILASASPIPLRTYGSCSLQVHVSYVAFGLTLKWDSFIRWLGASTVVFTLNAECLCGPARGRLQCYLGTTELMSTPMEDRSDLSGIVCVCVYHSVAF